MEYDGDEGDPDRPHKFWIRYNEYLVRHGITSAMIDDAIDEMKARAGGGALLRDGVGELLDVCERAGVLVVLPTTPALITLRSNSNTTLKCTGVLQQRRL